MAWHNVDKKISFFEILKTSVCGKYTEELVVPELDEEPEDLLPLIFLVGTVVFFADAALEGAAVDSWKPR